jgi:hypothetical protein
MPLLEEIDDLKAAWVLMFPGVLVPNDGQWAIWRLTYPENSIRMGLAELGKKYLKLDGRMDREYMLRFASAVMSRSYRDSVESAERNKTQ